MAFYVFDGTWNEDEADSMGAEKPPACVITARRG